MNDLTFDKAAWDEYLYWQKQDKKTVKRINQLIRSIVRDGVMQGICTHHGKNMLAICVTLC